MVTRRGTNSVTKSVTKENQSLRVEDYASFGFWLRKRRRALDLTQAELARRSGCSAAMIRKIEADERRPSLQLAELLAEKLLVPTEQYGLFIQFARGVDVGGIAGLELPGSEGRLVLPSKGSPTGPTGTEAKIVKFMTEKWNFIHE